MGQVTPVGKVTIVTAPVVHYTERIDYSFVFYLNDAPAVFGNPWGVLQQGGAGQSDPLGLGSADARWILDLFNGGGLVRHEAVDHDPDGRNLELLLHGAAEQTDYSVLLEAGLFPQVQAAATKMGVELFVHHCPVPLATSRNPFPAVRSL